MLDIETLNKVKDLYKRLDYAHSEFRYHLGMLEKVKEDLYLTMNEIDIWRGAMESEFEKMSEDMGGQNGHEETHHG